VFHHISSTLNFPSVNSQQLIELEGRAGRAPGGTIVLPQERTEQSRTIPSLRKNECLEHVLKNIGKISKRTERNGTAMA